MKAFLRARPEIEFIEENRQLRRQFTPSDPLLDEQWQHNKIGSQKAWDFGLGSSSVTVAIVDYPFNLDHPDLKANALQGWDVVNEVPITSGNDDHASSSAGMVAAVVDNAIGVAGMANCSVLPINVRGEIADMDAAIRWAADHGVRVVNISWEGADSPTLNEAAKYLREQTDGIVVMSGVNGSGFLDYTNQPYIIAVSMTDSSDALCSKYGNHIDFSAPGWLVKTTTASGYASVSGTSFSSPLVAGVFADLFSLNPSLTAEEAIEILRETAVDLGDPGWDQKFGWGRVDFARAAWMAAVDPDLILSIQPTNGTLSISTPFYVGLSYSLWHRDDLSSTNVDWYKDLALPTTNGNTIEFQVDPDSATQSFFKVLYDLDF